MGGGCNALIVSGLAKGSGNLWLTLSARFEIFDIVGDAVFYALVVAGFKVQGIVVCVTAPETAIQGAITDEHY